MTSNQTKGMAAGVVISIIIIIASVAFLNQTSTQFIQGEIEIEELIVSSKLPGRLGEVLVERGQRVAKGDLIFTIVSPEIEAKLSQAEAGRNVVDAVARQAENGFRAQEVEVAREEWQKAIVAEELYRNTYLRVNNLYEEGVVPLQLRDEAHAQWRASELTVNSMKQVYNMLVEGTRPEIIAATRAEVEFASATIDEVNAFRADTEIRSWIDAEVSELILHPGEIAPPGFPVVMLADVANPRAVFAIREDALVNFKVGDQLDVSIPALGDESFSFEVVYISVMGNFATWRATDRRQGYDMRTFEVELKPVQPIEHLRAGMSVLIELPGE